MVCLVGTIIVSTLSSFDPYRSTPKAVLLLASITLFYLTVIIAARTYTALRWTLRFYLGVGTVVGVVGFASIDWQIRSGLFAGVVDRLSVKPLQLVGMQEAVNPNQLAGVMLWLVPLAAALTFHGWSSFRTDRKLTISNVTGAVLLTCISGSGLGLVLLTQSRSAIAGLAVGLVSVALILTPRQHRYAVCLLGGSLAVAPIVYLLSRTPILDYASGTTPVSTLVMRVEIWARAIDAIQDFPFTGAGLNGFRAIIHHIYPLTAVPPTVDIAHAHNTWLQVALDLGLPGLIAYVAIVFGTLTTQVEVLRRAVDGRTDSPAISAGVIGCLAAFVVYGLTDTVGLGAVPGFLFWILLGIAIAAWKLGTRCSTSL